MPTFSIFLHFWNTLDFHRLYQPNHLTHLNYQKTDCAHIFHLAPRGSYCDRLFANKWLAKSRTFCWQIRITENISSLSRTLRVVPVWLSFPLLVTLIWLHSLLCCGHQDKSVPFFPAASLQKKYQCRLKAHLFWSIECDKLDPFYLLAGECHFTIENLLTLILEITLKKNWLRLWRTFFIESNL